MTCPSKVHALFITHQRRCDALGSMKTQTTIILASLLGTALAATNQKPALPAGWQNARLATATYLILDPQVSGNVGLISGGDQQTVLRAMKKDSGDAIQRRYPKATIVRAPAQAKADAIRVTPAMTAPPALLPWSKLNVNMILNFPEGGQVNLTQQFSVLELWQHRSDAANYAYDQLALRLP